MAPKKDDAKKQDDKPTQAEFGQTVSALAKHGVLPSTATAIGLTKDKTRRENTDKLKAYFRELPKAKEVKVKDEETKK